MLYTTVPSFIISLALYGIIGTRYKSNVGDIEQISSILETLSSTFTITPLIFIAPAIVIWMIVFKAPAVPGLIGGTMVGVLFSILQGYEFKSTLYSLMYGFEITTGNAIVDNLLNRGGLASMLEIIALVICALAFGGLIKHIGVIDTILETLLKRIRSRGSIILSTVIASISMNFMAADQYMAIVIPGQMFEPAFKKLNLHSKNLSRTLEDAGTLTSGLVPWSTCGAFYFATLGVSAFKYAPFHFLGLINPIIAIIYGYIGWSLAKLDPNKPIKN